MAFQPSVDNALNDLVAESAAKALQEQLISELREAGIRVKSIPKVRQHIVELLGGWSRRSLDLPGIYNTLLDRVHADTSIWERVPSKKD